MSKLDLCPCARDMGCPYEDKFGNIDYDCEQCDYEYNVREEEERDLIDLMEAEMEAYQYDLMDYNTFDFE